MFETPSVLKTKLIYVLGRTDAWCAISEWDFKLNHLNRADGWIAISEWDFILIACQFKAHLYSNAYYIKQV